MNQRILPTPAEIVAKARKFSGENQKVFGKRFLKTQSQISKYERGEIEPPADIIIHCMTFFNEPKKTRNLSPKSLAQDIEALEDNLTTLSLRRAIRNMLQLNERIG